MSEHTEQCAVIQWARLHEERYPALKLLFAVPNGGYRNKVTAIKLQEEGVKSGVPDLLLPIARKRVYSTWAGLAIEMKDGKNKTTPNQDWWLQSLSDYGWCTQVCHSADEAIKAISEYLGIPVEVTA